MSNLEQKAAILDYWLAIELFSPQTIPRTMPNDPVEPVFSVTEKSLFPWQVEHPLQRRRLPPQTARRYQVYCGIYHTEKVKTILEEKFGKDPESFDKRSDGESCLLSFSVSHQGRPLFDTFVISTCAWATGRTLDPGPEDNQWLKGFDRKSEELSDQFAEHLAILSDDEEGKALQAKNIHIGRPLTYADILQETQHIAKSLGIAELSDCLEIRVKATLVSLRKQYTTEDQDFLNSFFLKDLDKISKQIQLNNLGEGLKTYLTDDKDLDLTKRTDVRKSLSTLLEQLSPHLFPFGRWPSKGHHPLVFSQQFATNSIMQELKQRPGLFAVNGPPGTGKTTLLRDLMSGIVVERALCLSQLERPESAFYGEHRWKTDKYTRVISLWKEQFKGFEIVIASNNNGAVENVTLEIPGQEAIDSTWLKEINYFSELASQLIDQPAWAMIAARLGNKANRNDFVNRFWYSNKKASDNDKTESDEMDFSFHKTLKSFETESINWQEAVNRFKCVFQKEQQLRTDRLKPYQIMQDYLSAKQSVIELESDLHELSLQEKELCNKMQMTKASEQEQLKITDSIKINYQKHRQFRPGFWEILFTLGKAFREWCPQAKHLMTQINLEENKLTEINKQINTLQQNLVQTKQLIQQIKDQLTKKLEMLATNESALLKAQKELGDHFPSLEDWAQDENTRELSSPWSDPEWNTVRAEVFLAALQLHKAFIVANADCLRKNLQAAMDVLTGSLSKNVTRESIEAAWTSLFFVIPVVSTTFASFDRLFSHLDRESLGWLLIDEAGQAAPQTAAGAIWRSKRIVVVGDPLQLKPVIVIPFTAQQALRKHYHVAETWLPGTTSVQQLADRVSRFGTYLKTQDSSIWVGSPLRVHRRCDQPMFDICNQTTYDGLMVFGTPFRSPIHLPPSTWLHVSSHEADGHWIAEEGAVAENLISALLQNGIAANNLFLISPFREVVRQLFLIAQQFRGVRAGTIHTVQGKESDIVILVLGGNPQKPGAKKWASEEPNLLNVAVSRAKRRLYVIGNKEAWSHYPYFSTAVTLLSN